MNLSVYRHVRSAVITMLLLNFKLLNEHLLLTTSRNQLNERLLATTRGEILATTYCVGLLVSNLQMCLSWKLSDCCLCNTLLDQIRWSYHFGYYLDMWIVLKHQSWLCAEIANRTYAVFISAERLISQPDFNKSNNFVGNRRVLRGSSIGWLAIELWSVWQSLMHVTDFTVASRNICLVHLTGSSDRFVWQVSSIEPVCWWDFCHEAAISTLHCLSVGNGVYVSVKQLMTSMWV